MHARPNARPWWPLALLLTAALSACSTSSPLSPVQPPPVAPPVIPDLPDKSPVYPLGTWLERYCLTIDKLSKTLKTSLLASDNCKPVGQK